jgi:Zn-dependent protease
VSLIHPAEQGGGPSFRLAGVPIQVRWTFFVFTVLFGSSLEKPTLIVSWIVLVGVSLLVHELGHAFAFRIWDVDSRIVLHPMGGVTIPMRGDLPSRSSSVIVSLAGPVSGMVLLGLPALLLLRADVATDPWDDVLRLAIWVNVVWSVVNLLPILPLDGGNVARAVLNGMTKGKGELPARWLSIVVAGVVGLFAISQEFLFGGLYALFFLYDNLRALRTGRVRAETVHLKPVAEALEAGDATRTMELADGVLARTHDPRVRAMAIELSAWAALSAGNVEQARRAVAGNPPNVELSGHLRAFVQETDRAERVNATVDAWLDQRYVPARTYVALLQGADLADVVVDRLLASHADDAEPARMGLQHALFLGGDFDRSARLGEAMLGNGTTEPIVAFNVACAHARSGRRDAAFRALDQAVGLGFRDRRMLEDDEDLAALRTDPRYAMVRNRLSG